MKPPPDVPTPIPPAALRAGAAVVAPSAARPADTGRRHAFDPGRWTRQQLLARGDAPAAIAPNAEIRTAIDASAPPPQTLSP
jgi:hypothetical protein